MIWSISEIDSDNITFLALIPKVLSDNPIDSVSDMVTALLTLRPSMLSVEMVNVEMIPPLSSPPPP